MNAGEIAVVLKLVDQFSGPMRQAANAAAGGNSALTRSIQQAATAGQAAARNLHGYSSALQQMTRAASDAGRGIGSFATNLGKLTAGAGLAVFGIGQIAGAARGAMDALFGFNARAEQTTIGLTTLLKSSQAASAMMADLTKLAAQTPFELAGLTNATQKLLAFGFEAKSVIPMLTSLGDAMAAMGKGPAEIERLVIALGQIRAKGKLQGDEVLQFAEVGIPVWEILSQKMGKSTAELQKMSEQGKLLAQDVIPLLVSGMGERFAGAMENQSKSFSGMVSTIKDNLNIAFGEITKPAFERARVELQRFLEFTNSPQFTAWKDRMAEGVDQFADRVADFLQTEGPAFLKLFGDVSTGALGLADDFATIATKANEINDALGGEGWKLLLTAGAGAKVGGAPGAVAAVIGTGIAEDIQREGFVRGWLKNAFNAGVPGSTTLTDPLRGPIERGVGAAGGFLKSLPGRARAAFTDEPGIEPMPRQAAAMAEETSAIDATAAAYQRAADAAQTFGRLKQQMVAENTTSAMKANTAESFAQARAFDAMTEAAAAYQEIQTQLANTYETGIGLQKVYSQTQAEYKSQIDAINEAVEVLQKRQAEGGILSESDQELMRKQGDLVGRLAGGMDDLAVSKGKAAAANVELMTAQDALNELMSKSDASAEDYEAAMARVQDATERARQYGLDPAQQAGLQFQQSLANLQNAITQTLVPAIAGLQQALLDLKAPPPIEIQVATDAAYAEIRNLKAYAGAPVSMVVNATRALVDFRMGTPGAPQEYASGGTVPHKMWAMVNEYGPELMSFPYAGAFAAGGTVGFARGGSKGLALLPGGTEIIPADQTRDILQAADVAQAMIDGLAKDLGRLPEMLGRVSDEVAVELNKIRQQLEGQLDLALLAGDDQESIDKLRSQLDAANGLLEAWGAESGKSIAGIWADAFALGAEHEAAEKLAESLNDIWRDALSDTEAFRSGQVLFDLQQTYQEALQRLSLAESLGAPADVLTELTEEAQRAEQAVMAIATAYGQLGIQARDVQAAQEAERALVSGWRDSLRDLDAIAKGDGLTAATKAVTDLQQQLQVARALGLDQAVITSLEESLSEALGALDRARVIHDAARKLGIGIAAPLAEGVAESLKTAMGSLGKDGQFSKAVLDAYTAGRLSLEQALDLTKDVTRDKLLEIRDEIGGSLIKAILSGNDTAELRRQMEAINALLGTHPGGSMDAYEELIRGQLAGLDPTQVNIEQRLREALDARKRAAEHMTDDEAKALLEAAGGGPRIGEPLEIGPTAAEVAAGAPTVNVQVNVTANIDGEAIAAKIESQILSQVLAAGSRVGGRS